jgi:hypothetical protein
MKTTIKHEDGNYGTPARLEINFEIPDVLSSDEQTTLTSAISDIIKIYDKYKPKPNEVQS